MRRTFQTIALVFCGVLWTAFGGGDAREMTVRRLIGAGRYDEAFERTATIIEASPERQNFYRLLAETGQYSGRVREADSILGLCARKGCGVPDALLAEGWLDAHRACWLDAYTHYQSAVHLGGPSVVAFAGIQEMHEKLHGRESAISHLLALTHARDRTSAVWYALALAYWSQWDLSQAQTAVEQSLRSGATDPRVSYLQLAIRSSRDPGRRQRRDLAAALNKATALGDWEGTAFLQWVRMNACMLAGLADSAESARGEGLRLSREYGLIGWMGQYLLQGGRAAFSRGEIPGAIAAADSAEAWFRLAGEYDGILAAYSLRMSILLESYRYPEALDCCFRMLQQIDDRCDPRLHAGAAIDAAWILSRIGGQRIALVLGIHAESILEKMLYAAHDRCRLNSTLAVIHASLGDTVLAFRYARTASEIAKGSEGNEELQASCEGVLGDLECGRGNRAVAREHFLRQWRCADRVSNLGEKKSAAHALAALAVLQDRRADGFWWTDTAQALARHSNDLYAEEECHEIRACFAGRTGDRVSALEECAEARRCLGALRRLRLVCSLTREMREWYLEHHAELARTFIRNGDLTSAADLMAVAREDMVSAGITPPNTMQAARDDDRFRAEHDRRALSSMIHRWIFKGLIEDVAYSDTAIRTLGSFFATTVPRWCEADDAASRVVRVRDGNGAIAGRLKASLGNQEIGVDFLCGQESTDVLAFTTDTIAHCRLDAGRTKLATLVEDLIERPAGTLPGGRLAHAEMDCDHVFAPLLSLLARIAGSRDQVVIIGSGVQSRIPFEALRWGGGPDRESLVERFAVSYRPSLWGGSRGQVGRPSFDDRILIVGDPEIPVRGSGDAEAILDPEHQGQVSGLIQSLPGTMHEIAVLKDLYGPDLDILRGGSATKEKFCSIVSRYRIVHIATHGSARSAGHNDHVLFLPTSDGANGELRMEDILTLDLHASLVVLPACLSARPSAAGDVESIAEAFLEAGAASVLAARSTVDDDMAAEFFRAFYGAIGAGESRTMAVRSAMRTMIAHGHHASHLWAGFQLLGEGGTLSSARETRDVRSGENMFAWVAMLTVTTIIMWFAWRNVRLKRSLHADRKGGE